MLASFPRSGNSWTKLMLAELLAGSAEVNSRSKEWLVPAVGEHLQSPRLLPGGGRLIKTHEPYCRAYGRSIYLVRDVRDVAVSFRELRIREGFDEDSFKDFLVRFARGAVGGYGSWQEHVASWLAVADVGSDILVVRYEELVKDPAIKLGEMARFLGVSADEAHLREIVGNNPVGKVRDDKDQFYDQRAPGSDSNNPTNRWHAHYSESELAFLEPTMQAMRQAGYIVES
jgi:hypothetical protein